MSNIIRVVTTQPREIAAMEATGALCETAAKANLLALQALSRRGADLPLRSRVPLPLAHGHVLRLIVEILAESPGSLRVCEIRAVVEEQLGRPVSWSTVKNALASNTLPKVPNPRFARVSYGRYQLRRETAG